ncbi:FAD/NAD(P)-binding domain-containing protein [Hymenopellis radicata]|nr:FAD/NAD(P)-binding domain-containing protein [Hymenopellis radicata]
MVVSDRDALEKTAFARFDKVFHDGKGTFVQAAVTAVQKTGKKGGSVTLDNGEKIPFDVLVLATGANWPGPLAFPNDEEAVTEWLATRRKEFENAKSIVIAGGGAVGLEIAGEIKDLWPTKPITVVQALPQLLNDTYPDKFRRRAEASFVARGVKFVYKDYVDDFTPVNGSVKTRNGKTLDGDLVVAAWGTRPNTEFLSSLGSDVLDSKGFVKVTPTLQLLNHSEIFALGDITDIKEQKQAAKAQLHAGVVSANILSYIKNGTAPKKYKGAPEMILVTNGKEDGLAYLGLLWGITLGAWMARMAKSRTLIVPQFRESMGL